MNDKKRIFPNNISKVTVIGDKAGEEEGLNNRQRPVNRLMKRNFIQIGEYLVQMDRKPMQEVQRKRVKKMTSGNSDKQIAKSKVKIAKEKTVFRAREITFAVFMGVINACAFFVPRKDLAALMLIIVLLTVCHYIMRMYERLIAYCELARLYC